jgi:hypothetical protein
MTTKIETRLFEETLRLLPPTEFKIWACLLGKCGGVEKSTVRIQHKHIESACDLNYTTVSKGLRSLIKRGLIRIVEGKRVKHAQEYWVWIGDPDDEAPDFTSGIRPTHPAAANQPANSYVGQPLLSDRFKASRAHQPQSPPADRQTMLRAIRKDCFWDWQKVTGDEEYKFVLELYGRSDLQAFERLFDEQVWPGIQTKMTDLELLKRYEEKI